MFVFPLAMGQDSRPVSGQWGHLLAHAMLDGYMTGGSID